MMDMGYNRKLILEDGEEYYGFAFGYTGDKVLEIVFNTSMVGYQEILSDPSYTDQAVVMTYPLIGNYGMAADDYETKVPTVGAFIVREYNDEPSNFRSEKSLAEVMIQHRLSGIYGVDTRKLTRSIRNKGSRKCLLTSADTSLDIGLKLLNIASTHKDVVSRVSCGSIWCSDVKYGRFHVVAIDCGMKMNIVRSLNARGCNVTIVPWNTPAETIEALKPDGVFISNGPGDPNDVQPVIDTVRGLRGKYPMFGICLGHQIIEYRRKIIYKELRQDIQQIIKDLCKWKGIEIIEGHMMPDHVHLLVSIPPKYSVSQIMGYLKGKSAMMIFERHANLKYKFGNRNFWATGYYVSTVGINTATVQKYIREQDKQDQIEDSLSRKEYEDPFKGSK